MALTKFVRNVDDLSDDGGYKFRFCCDRCDDGVESAYVSSSLNLLKTGLEIFSMFRSFGGSSRRAVENVDRGLRGKERDAAYEEAVHQATSHFHKCSHCGNWVCGHCWNTSVGMCEGCAPDAHEAAAKEAAQLAQRKQVAAVRDAQATSHPRVTCPVCGQEAGGGKFCRNCGTNVAQTRACGGCKSPLDPTARFCGECGTRC